MFSIQIRERPLNLVRSPEAGHWCRLLKDENFRKDLLSRIAKTGAAIEEALGSAQDVEGCVSTDGEIFVVQTRPQM
jgi:hypothetical protein